MATFDDLYLDAHEPVGIPPEEPCCYGCGVYGFGPDLLRHEREEHATCPHCGEEPDGEHAVSHKPGCRRLTANDPADPPADCGAAPGTA